MSFSFYPAFFSRSFYAWIRCVVTAARDCKRGSGLTVLKAEERDNLGLNAALESLRKDEHKSELR